jgi:hypothetical protein
MATGMLLEFPGFTKEHYDRVNDALNLGEHSIEGLILHTSGPTPAGWRVYDIWESTGAFERFVEERLMPTLQEAGLVDESGAAPQCSRSCTTSTHRIPTSWRAWAPPLFRGTA